MEKLRLESCGLPNATGSLAETAFLNSIVVLWLPPKRNVKGMFVLILLIKAGLDGVGEGIQDPTELWPHGWLGGESQMPWTQGAGRGCWTSPGEDNVRECLGRGEEGKDDPVHHPFHLRGQRAALAGVGGASACQLHWVFCGEGNTQDPSFA